jgi:replicative DNA helicase
MTPPPVGEISARARSWQSRCERQGKKLAFIVIDYLKFLRSSDRYRGQRHYEVGEITSGLKALAKDLDIAVVLLVQLNRDVEKTADKRPDLAHLRESGDIEADADVVLLLFRPAYYSAMTNDIHLPAAQNEMEIIIAKQRMGQTGIVKVLCNTRASALRNLGLQ